jgi:type I restriction enzyme M protein
MPPPTLFDTSLGFEQKLWESADLLRSNMDPAEYKHVVLGLLFLKYISDAFDARRDELASLVRDPGSEYHVEGADAQADEIALVTEDRDEYAGANVFWVPQEARWDDVRARAHQDQIELADGRKVSIGGYIDHVMDVIERENPRLKGALPKVYGRPGLDQTILGKLVDLLSNVGLYEDKGSRRDVLGRVYEYFLSRFASAEGKGGGEFYTPASVVRLLVEMIEPYRGRVYDPCCGSGGMFVQSVKFTEAHGGRRDQVSVYGQESNYTTWRLARMNLAIRGIEADLGPRHADTFREDVHPDLRADFVLANPPFNVSEWHGDKLRDDARWKHGTPPEGNANFAWVQHIVHHLAPGGVAGFVLANGSMSSMQSGEGEIRRRLVEADLVDCMVALPSQLFYATGIPVCLWFLSKDRGGQVSAGGKAHRDRKGEVLFIDARGLGRMETRVHRVLDDADVERIAGVYHAWRNEGGGYEDEAGFCKSASVDEIEGHDYVLTPGRYVGVAEIEGDGEPFDEKMERLVDELREQMVEAADLDRQIEDALEGAGFAL